jgi:hypothetical protein
MKTNALLVALLTLLSTIAVAQENVNLNQIDEKIPHPYIKGSFELMPGGYASTAEEIGGGLTWDKPHFVFESYAGYDNGRKSNDNTVNNYKGHDRYLRGDIAYKIDRGYYFGVGGRWSQLSTTNYTKGGSAFNASSWHPAAIVGKDYFREKYSARGQFGYFFKSPNETVNYPDGTHCNKCGNGTNGFEVSFMMPSPATARHFFFREDILVYWFHDTVTDPTNLVLTQEQIGHGGHTAAVTFSLLYRF